MGGSIDTASKLELRNDEANLNNYNDNEYNENNVQEYKGYVIIHKMKENTKFLIEKFDSILLNICCEKIDYHAIKIEYAQQVGSNSNKRHKTFDHHYLKCCFQI